MLKRSLVLITMQILLLFFRLINIIGKAYFLWVHNYEDKSFICFVSTVISKSNWTLMIVAWKYPICSKRMSTAWNSTFTSFLCLFYCELVTKILLSLKMYSVFRLVKLFPRTQVCEIKNCFLPANQSPTWSKRAFSLVKITVPLML